MPSRTDAVPYTRGYRDHPYFRHLCLPHTAAESAIEEPGAHPAPQGNPDPGPPSGCRRKQPEPRSGRAGHHFQQLGEGPLPVRTAVADLAERTKRAAQESRAAVVDLSMEDTYD